MDVPHVRPGLARGLEPHVRHDAEEPPVAPKLLAHARLAVVRVELLLLLGWSWGVVWRGMGWGWMGQCQEASNVTESSRPAYSTQASGIDQGKEPSR